MNKPYTEILNIKLEDVIGKPIKSIIPTTKLPEVIASGKADIGALMTLYDHKTSRDIRFVCNRIPLIEDGEIIGGVAISTFNEMGEIYHLYSEVEKMQQQNELYQQTIEQLRKQTNPLDYIIGSSQAIGHIKSTIAIFANSGLSLLLTGETGVGKEVFANALHQLSSRSASNFVKINCAAIPKDLLESELFGYEGGAFTGAKKGGKIGKFELADGGTLLLDEIGEMPLPLQSKLLRVLQEKEIERVGETTPRKVDVRVLAATHRDLKKAIAEGTFREDLYYRLNVMNIRIPPLRKRVEDIPLLAEHFRLKFNGQYAKSIAGVSTEVMEIFMGHPWPGNVRELEHVIERAFVLCGGEMIRPEHIALEAAARPARREETVAASPADEKQRLLVALEKAAWNISKSARLLGVSRWTLYRRLLRHGLERPGEEL